MNIDDVIAERIAAALRRREAAKERRTTLQAARQAGLAQRHAAKLRHQAAADEPEPACTCTFGAQCAQCTETEGGTDG